MHYTFEARLPATPELDELLASNAAHWSWGLRQAWTLLYRHGLSPAQAYAALSQNEFTSKQVGSLLVSAQMRHAAIVELKQYEARQLALGIERRELALAQTRRKIASLEKRQTRLRAMRDKFAPQAGQGRSRLYSQGLEELRIADCELAFCRNWVRQKERGLRAKQGKQKSLLAAIDAGRYKLCFGSAKLLAQRPGVHNQATTPYASVEKWREAWEAARNGQWWAIGHTNKPCGNPEVQWLSDTKQLRIRLTDKLAHARMDARGVPHSGTEQKFMPLRMQCRFLLIDGVDFVSHKGFARAALIEAFGKRPVTMRVLCRLQPDGSRAWYVQACVDVPTTLPFERFVTKEQGALGLDFNARGVAWCAVKPDGNRLAVNEATQCGFEPWDLKGLPAPERKQVIGTVAAKLSSIAVRLSTAVAIENLDFSAAKTGMRAGPVNKTYNDMLGALPSAQFAHMMQRACERQQLKLYLVNPWNSSVGGFSKYGRSNRMNADTSAALWLGRQAMYGAAWKTAGACCFVRKHHERLVLSHLRATPMQRMKALSGVQWKDVARALGKNRKVWGVKLHDWWASRVEAASAQHNCEPALTG